MTKRALRKALGLYLLLLVPLAWLAARYDRYGIDGDAVAYLDLSDLVRQHRWTDLVNGYWHPLYPALLALGQVALHTSVSNELEACYAVNLILFFLQVAAVLWCTQGLIRLRRQCAGAEPPLLSPDALRLVSLALLTLSMMRELSLGKVRTDGLLQALVLCAVGCLLHALAAPAGRAVAGWSAAMGLCLALAYLTKSVAFPLTLVSLLLMVGFGWLAQGEGLGRATLPALPAAAVFLLVAGPYVAALSQQRHRFDFGDSGTLNYAWYVSGTEKMHLQPWMTERFGSATVHLLHPERQVLRQPGVYSYRAHALGTYPPWFDPAYFNERVTPRFSLRQSIRRGSRNLLLSLRYLLNHVEGLLLLILCLRVGGSFRLSHRYAWPGLILGLSMWGMYATVNVEERYVTSAYLMILLSLLAALVPGERAGEAFARRAATTAVVLLAMLTLGELARQDLANRRDEIVAGEVPAWRNREMYGAAEALRRMGVSRRANVACVGEQACLGDFYWARLAGVRIMAEIYQPAQDHLVDRLGVMKNLPEVYAAVRDDGAQVLVGSFDPGEMNSFHPAAAGWVRLGEGRLYALPLRSVGEGR